MNKNIFKQFALIFSFLLVFANLSFIQPQISLAENLNQAVTITAIDGEGNSETKAIEFMEGESAQDILEKVATIDFDQSDMISGINGVYPDWNKFKNFWGFTINGKMAEVGAANYSVNHGDNILFLLTDGSESQISVTVSATDGDNKVFNKEVKLSPSATAYDAIKQVAESLDATVHPEYLTYIENVDDYEIADNQFWEVSSNGEALNVGVLSHQVQPGEHIQLRLQSFDDGSDDEEDPELTPEENEENEENNQEKPDENTNENENKENNEQTKPEEQTKPSKELTKKVVQEVDFLANYVLTNNLATEYGNEWWVWGLGKSNQKVPQSYLKSIENYLHENQGFQRVTELEKVIIALSTAGVDATDIAGYDLIDDLANHKNLEKPNDISAAVFALIAANSGDYDFNSTKEKELIQFILDEEIDGGGWSYFGDQPSIDITGMTLIALANYEDQVEVKDAIDRAVNYLSKEQVSNGGYEEPFVGNSSATVSQVIMGLVSVGVDPTSSDFTKNNNLVGFLLQHKNDDGLYKNLIKDIDSDEFFATPQAFLALAYYKNFAQLEDSVDPVTPKPQKPSPEKKPTPEKPSKQKGEGKNPKQSKKPEVIVKPSTKVDSKKLKISTTIQTKDLKDIKDNGIIVIEPEHAKEQIELEVNLNSNEIEKLIEKNNELKINKGDTTLQIPSSILKQLAAEAKNQPLKIQLIKQEVEGALGAVYDYIILAGSKEISDFDGEVTFTLEVNPDLVKNIDPNKIKAFYYNSQSGEWEVIADSIYDANKGIVTAKTNHFSIFGVFEYDNNVINATPAVATQLKIDSNDKELPNTATNMYNLLGLGAVALLIGSILHLTNRRKTKLNQ